MKNTLITVGKRGAGKTLDTKKKIIESFLKTGKQFVYVSRSKEELKRVKTFFDDISGEFPEHEFKVHGKEFIIDGEIAGYFAGGEKMPIATIKVNEPQGIIKTPIETALEKIKELEIQVSDLTLRVEMLDSLNSDIIADFNDLKEQFALMQIEKEKPQND